MAFIIDTINGSGLYAQSAASASVATYDSNGNDITATYLTAHQPISADEWNDVYNTVNVYSGSWTGGESSPTASVDSNGSIDIVSSNNTVYFDVNGTWFNNAVNSALPTSSVQWNSNYDTVNTNSGVWGGSALNISAGEGVKVTLVNNNLVFSTDETVLWSGSRTSAVQTSESMKNFDKCQVYIAHGTYGPPQVYTIDFSDMETTGYFAITRPRGSTNLNIACIRLTADDTHIAAVNAKCLAFGSWTTTATGVTATTGESEDLNSIIRVVGINRINNA